MGIIIFCHDGNIRMYSGAHEVPLTYIYRRVVYFYYRNRYKAKYLNQINATLHYCTYMLLVYLHACMYRGN